MSLIFLSGFSVITILKDFPKTDNSSVTELLKVKKQPCFSNVLQKSKSKEHYFFNGYKPRKRKYWWNYKI